MNLWWRVLAAFALLGTAHGGCFVAQLEDRILRGAAVLSSPPVRTEGECVQECLAFGPACKSVQMRERRGSLETCLLYDGAPGEVGLAVFRRVSGPADASWKLFLVPDGCHPNPGRRRRPSPAWEAWGPCSSGRCGRGRRVRRQACPFAPEPEEEEYGDDEYIDPAFDEGDDEYGQYHEEEELEGSGCPLLKTSPAKPRRRPVQQTPCGSPCGLQRPWGEWSACSASCGPGTRERSRDCNGGGCAGARLDTQPCDAGPCAAWAAWAAWGECSLSCGLGRRFRSRECEGGAFCHGRAKEGGRCPGLPPCAKWAAWGPWGPATASCGTASRSRRRECIVGSCEGDFEEAETLDGGPCPAWVAWTNVGACSTTCGPGTQKRTRSCPSGLCPGASADTAPCHSGDCDAVSAWTPWSRCPATCGDAEQSRSRSCLSPGGCIGMETTGRRPCSAGPCPNWNAWSAWADCDCGARLRRRSRQCLEGHREECAGPNKQSEPCSQGFTYPMFIVPETGPYKWKMLQDTET